MDGSIVLETEAPQWCAWQKHKQKATEVRDKQAATIGQRQQQQQQQQLHI